MGCCSVRCGLIAGATIGALLAVLGGVLIPVGNSIIKDNVKKEAVIENGTTAYENWVSTGGIVYRQFWLFDVKNPLEVLQYGAKPVLTEKGPYTYRTRYLPKENITAHSNHTIAFILPAGAIFEPSLSVGPEEDNVTSLNLAVAGAYSLVPKELHGVLNLLIQANKASLFQYRTVKEILWGYQDPILSDIVGVFAPYNGTYDGYYNVFTGKDDISKVSIVDRWKGERQLNFWNDTYCDMINGTDASSFPPFLDKKKQLYFFSSDICRSVSAEFDSSQDLKGIEVYRFMLPALTLAAPSTNPDNLCYCKDTLVTRNCTMAGVLDVSSCRDGAPIYISLPHFLHGSAFLREAVIGLNPSEDQHSTFLDVEPITGFTMRFAKRLQVNMMYGPSNTITVLKQIKDYTIFPVLWLNETAALDDETADMFKAELTSRIQLLEAVQVALLSVGSIVCVLCSIASCVVDRNSLSKLV
ncbi:platelet glycoprotein 4 [Megalops cyprinoides]|uniref:platelet glycoprotein 4 n=1 Tax=Megalops cyprinoides TaxID=118141 RepID=UPI001865260A|nr:platelet glycoprotein 4 [Megalops cyprinoides]